MRTFVDYAASFDPAFPSRIRGASPQEIADLEAEAGHPLPDAYRAFLSLMGHGADQLVGGAEVRTDVSELIEFYGENVASGEDQVPDDCIVIGVGGVAVEQVLLEYNHPGRVFEGDSGEKHSLWADSLEKLLYKRVYMRYRPKQLPFSGIFTSAVGDPMMDAALNAAILLGFAPQWFSDSISFCGEAPGAVLILNQFGGQGFSMRIAAKEREQVEVVSRSIVQATGPSLQRDR
jgi:hypothetical protein